MKSTISVSLALLTPLALAVPSINKARSSTGSILEFPITKRGLDIRSLGPDDRILALEKSVLKTKIKYGIPVEEPSERLRKRDGTDVLMGGIDEAFFASIVVGTPPLQYEVVLDTGSSDLVLATTVSNTCGSTCTTTAHLYNPAQSSSSKDLGFNVYVPYGTASANGTLYSDIVEFAGHTQTVNLTAAFAADSLTGAPDEDGLMGLAWQTISASGSMPFVQGLYEAGALTEPLFGFAMANLDPVDQTNKQAVVSGGVLTIGGTNSSYYTGTIAYTDLVDTGTYWNIPLDNIGVGGTELGIAYATGVTIDSGTNTLALPGAAADAIYQQIPGAAVYSSTSGLYSYPCSTAVALTFTFGGQVYTVNSKDFNFGAADSSGKVCIGAVTSNGDSAQAAATWIIGTPLLMTYYTSYRFNPPSVGFAPINDPSGILEKGAVPVSNGTAGGSSSGGGTTTAGGSSPSSSASAHSGVSQTTVSRGALALVLGGAIFGATLLV